MSATTEFSRLASSREVTERITSFFERRIAGAARYGGAFEQLWRLAEDASSGGKLVRPLLLLDVYDALAPERGGAESAGRETALDVAVAVELLHFSFLLHDDVIDQDTVRRGRPNLVGALLEQARESATAPRSHTRRLHWARTGAILMGDLLLSACHQEIARAEVSRRQRVDLLDLLERTVSESVAGELTDVGLSHGLVPARLATVIGMTTHKTATCTFELPLRAGAILAGADAGTQDVLGAVGRHLGLGFQLQDDLLSTFGDPARHGKERYSDLREGKQTALIATARTTSSWPSIEPRLGRDGLTDQDAAWLAAELEACGARAAVEGLVREELAAAVELVDDPATRLAPSLRAVLRDLTRTLQGRCA
ncbi:polyprenyl synthetase family protein [Salana multivorans]